MTELNVIASSFSKEEQLAFINFLKKKNKRLDAKNIKLFKLLCDTQLNSKELCIKLYGEPKKNAYHALRKRLFQSIIHFSANMSLEEESSLQMQIIKYLLASRAYLQQKQFKIAYKVLKKAEVIAQEHYLYPLLNEIYHTQIQYAHTVPSIDLKALIKKFNSNKEKHQLEEQLNIVYARIKEKLNDAFHKKDANNFQTILNNTLDEYNINILDKMSFKSLYQLISIVSVSAFVTNDYLKIESFLINSYNTINQHKTKEKQLFYHIQIIYFIANTLFRNKKFDTSKSYLKQMHSLMQKQNQKYFTPFKLKYKLLHALNLNFTYQQNEAIDTLLPLINKKYTDIESTLDIHLSLIMFYMQQSDFKKAHQLFSKLYHSDNWYTEKAGKAWVIKKSLTEIILHIERNNIDLVDSKLLSFKRNHYNYLKSINQKRVITFLKFVKQYYNTPEDVSSTKFKATFEASFDWLTPEQEDIFVMSFYGWLKSKMDKAPVYDTTMALVHAAN